MGIETQRLIAWAMISTYWDCCQLDVGEGADPMLRGRQRD
jgi:hypothetical protein